MKKTKKYEEGGKTILDRSKGKLVSKSEYTASRAKPAAKAPSSVLDRDRTGMTPAAPKPAAPKPAPAKAPDRKSPITANFTKTGEQFKPNPLKRTKPAGPATAKPLTAQQKAGVDKAAGDLVKSAKGQDFRSSFAAARKAGKKEFTWNGKKYNTKLKGE